MKDFDISSPCIKCGYSGNAADIQYKVGIFSEELQEAINITQMGYPPDDYLLRTCRMCGYKWPERTIDP